jgi:hypothetical protein
MPVTPILVDHLLTIRAKPGQIFDFRTTNLTPLEKLSPTQHWMLVKQTAQQLGEFQQVASWLVQIPVDPRQLIVLTIGIIVAVLRAPNLIAGLQHRHALRQEKRRQEIALLTRS